MRLLGNNKGSVRIDLHYMRVNAIIYHTKC